VVQREIHSRGHVRRRDARMRPTPRSSGHAITHRKAERIWRGAASPLVNGVQRARWEGHASVPWSPTHHHELRARGAGTRVEICWPPSPSPVVARPSSSGEWD
jgi:hypothetical protein